MSAHPTENRWERLRQIGRRHGAWAVVRHVIDRAAARTLALDVNRLLWLDAERLQPLPSVDPEYTFRFFSASEIRDLAADYPGGTGAVLAGPLVPEGDLCFAATAGRRLAAYNWYALGSVDPSHCDGVALSLPPDAAYFYNGFTYPEHRGKGLYGRLMGMGLRALADRGIHKLLASVAWTNAAALKTSFRLGYVDLGYFVAFGRGRWRFAFPPRSAKHLGIEVVGPRFSR